MPASPPSPAGPTTPPSPPLTDEKSLSPTKAGDGGPLRAAGSTDTVDADMVGDEQALEELRQPGTPSSAIGLDEEASDAASSAGDRDHAAIIVAATLQPALSGAAPPLIRRAMATRLMQSINFEHRRQMNASSRAQPAQTGKRRRKDSVDVDRAAEERDEGGSGKRKMKRPGGKPEIDREDELELSMAFERLKGGLSCGSKHGCGLTSPLLGIDDNSGGAVTPRSITPTATEMFTEPTTPMLLHSPNHDMTPPGTPSAEALGFSGPLPSEDYILQRIEELRSEKRKVFAMIATKAVDLDMKDVEPSSSRRTTGDASTFSVDEEPPAKAGAEPSGANKAPRIDTSAERPAQGTTPATSPRAGSKRPGSPPLSPPPFPSKSPRTTDSFARPVPPRNDRPFFGHGYSHSQGGYREQEWHQQPKPRPSSMSAGYQPQPSSMSAGYQPHRYQEPPYQRAGQPPPGVSQFARQSWQQQPPAGPGPSGQPGQPTGLFYSSRMGMESRMGMDQGRMGMDRHGPPGPGPNPPASSSLSRGWQPKMGGGNPPGWNGWKQQPRDRDWS
ncbi:hypothetical protein DFJ74DRAFT_672305 [Hyaloraphidium curvatum]|nr:hypothetical protein DFJ74DRAFT_672305 [Hyaloraphidium curvatum]